MGTKGDGDSPLPPQIEQRYVLLPFGETTRLFELGESTTPGPELDPAPEIYPRRTQTCSSVWGNRAAILNVGQKVEMKVNDRGHPYRAVDMRRSQRGITQEFEIYDLDSGKKLGTHSFGGQHVSCILMRGDFVFGAGHGACATLLSAPNTAFPFATPGRIVKSLGLAGAKIWCRFDSGHGGESCMEPRAQSAPEGFSIDLADPQALGTKPPMKMDNLDGRTGTSLVDFHCNDRVIVTLTERWHPWQGTVITTAIYDAVTHRVLAKAEYDATMTVEPNQDDPFRPGPMKPRRPRAMAVVGTTVVVGFGKDGMGYFDVPEDLLGERKPEPTPEPEEVEVPPVTFWERLRKRRQPEPPKPSKAPMRRQRVALEWTLIDSPGGDGVDDFVTVENPQRIYAVVRHFGGLTWYRFCPERKEFVEHGETKFR